VKMVLRATGFVTLVNLYSMPTTDMALDLILFICGMKVSLESKVTPRSL
jgi:hypothetical protein